MSFNKNGAHLSRQQLEELSRRNAQAIIQGKDHLPSRGHTGNVWLPRLRRKLHYRSGLERRILLEIDGFHLVADIESEKLDVQYPWRGVTCRYVPDLLLRLTDGRIWMIEIKPASQLTEQRNLVKFDAARNFCKSMGDHLRFGVLTKEKDVKTLLPTHDGITLNERNRLRPK
jgi:hypothetical protein